MKKHILIISIVLLLLLVVASIYGTFAYSEKIKSLPPSKADYNIVYSLNEKANNEINILPKEKKFVSITLTNPYSKTVKYGMYYYLIEPETVLDGLNITLSKTSKNLLEDIIKPEQTKQVTLEITNKTDKSVKILVGALVGFEKGNISELVQKGEILIK